MLENLIKNCELASKRKSLAADSFITTVESLRSYTLVTRHGHCTYDVMEEFSIGETTGNKLVRLESHPKMSQPLLVFIRADHNGASKQV